VRVALCVGLTLLAGALALVLSGSPLIVIGSNAIPAHPKVAYVKGGFHTCQAAGTLPRGTTAIRLSASANTGPRIKLQVRSRARLITSGERDAGWGVDETVTVPVKRVPRSVASASICISFGQVIEPIQINGALMHAAAAGKRGSVVLLRFEYLRRGHATWWSLASTVARHMGYGHGPSGTWVVFVVLALMIALIALATRLALRELR
jgi:hypothetical protein